jgi:hypothetical protein
MANQPISANQAAAIIAQLRQAIAQLTARVDAFEKLIQSGTQG